MTDALLDLLADRRQGKFGIAGEVYDGTVGFFDELREPKFWPESTGDKKRINGPSVLAKVDEICNVVMVRGWFGVFALTWEEGLDFAVASISLRKKEKMTKANGGTI